MCEEFGADMRYTWYTPCSEEAHGCVGQVQSQELLKCSAQWKQAQLSVSIWGILGQLAKGKGSYPGAKYRDSKSIANKNLG